jgi:hypothetical protein
MSILNPDRSELIEKRRRESPTNPWRQSFAAIQRGKARRRIKMLKDIQELKRLKKGVVEIG